MPAKIERFFRFYFRVLKESLGAYFARHAMTQAAAMAYYMVFSLPPILVIVLWIAARFYKEAQMRNALSDEFGELVGRDGAVQLMATIERLNLEEPTWGATALGAGIMLFTATTVLVTARHALNQIADVQPDQDGQGGVWRMVTSRFVSFALLATIAIILLVSLVIETLVSALGRFVSEWSEAAADFMMVFDGLFLDLGAATVLVALFFRYLPDVRLPWRDIWPGALVTAILFSLGQTVIGFVIGQSNATDLYSAAGTVLILMLWVYYSSALFLFGAEFTFTRARLRKADND